MSTALLAAGAALLVVVAIAWPEQPSSPAPLLVADLRGHALVVVDPADVEDVRRIALPGGPHELLRLPDGRVVVSLEQSGALAVVDLDSGEVERTAVGGTPHGLALQGGSLLVTDRSVDAVRRFDLATWRELPSTPVDAWPHAVAVLPDGTIAVASAESGTLTIGDTHHVVGAVTETLALSPDGERVATASAHDGAVEVLSAEGELLGRYEVGGRPVRVAFAPDGETLAVALSAAHAVAVIRDGGIERVAVEGVPDGLAFSLDGRTLYASDVFGGHVTAVDLERLAVVAVIDAGRGTGAMLALRP